MPMTKPGKFDSNGAWDLSLIHIFGNDRRGRPAGVRRAEAVWMDAVWKWEEYFLKTDTGVCTEFSQFGK